MNKLLDANAILRYLLDDIDEQATIAAAAIESGAETLPEVLAEVVYVLEGVYSVSKNEISDSLIELLNNLFIENKAVIVQALKYYKEKNLDFVDCILLAHSTIKQREVLSFDKKLNKELVHLS